MNPVEIAAVDVAAPGDALHAHAIDTPAAGQRLAYYGLDVRGWALGRHSPAESVVVRHAAGKVREGGVSGKREDVAEQFPGPWSGSSGFFLPIGALRLPCDFELEVQVRLVDGAEARVASIAGRRAALRTGFEPSIEPVCLTALGRTGSTALTRLLSAHPRIAAYRPFEYEPRVVTYWIDVLADLAEPAAFRRQITPNGPLGDQWWVGAEEPFPRRLMDDDVQARLGGEGTEQLARFCQQRIDDLYRLVAERFERRDATHFVEKLGPATGALARELYPRAREIFLVRDFRDVAASIFAYNEKRGFQGFGRNRVASDAEYVSELMSESVAEFVHAWRTRSDGAHLVRYEDLVQRPREALAEILSYLELDAAAGTADAMLASLTEPASDVHRTRAVEDSVGRWERDLSDDVQAACARSLGEALAEFGYAP